MKNTTVETQFKMYNLQKVLRENFFFFVKNSVNRIVNLIHSTPIFKAKGFTAVEKINALLSCVILPVDLARPIIKYHMTNSKLIYPTARAQIRFYFIKS